MLILDISPLSKSVAIGEIVIILSVAAILGYFLAQFIARPGIRLLREEINEKQIELAACRALPAVTNPNVPATDIPNKGASKTVYPVHQTDPGVRQDLKIIEGIGPKIEEILNKNGIMNYEALSGVPPVRIAAMLRSAGPRFQIHDPTSWPRQATLAHEKKWEELNALKDRLIAGKAE